MFIGKLSVPRTTTLNILELWIFFKLRTCTFTFTLYHGYYRVLMSMIIRITTGYPKENAQFLQQI